MAKRIGPKMAAVKSYVETHPGCLMIRAAEYVAPSKYGRVGLGFGYDTVHRAVAAGVVRKVHGMRKGTFILVPAEHA